MFTETELRDMLRASADRASLASPPTRAEDLDLVPATPSDRPDRRARRIAAPLAIAAATVVLAGGAAVLARQGGDPKPDDAANAPTSSASTSAPTTDALPPRLHQPTTPLLDVFTVKGTKNVETYVSPEGEDLHGQQLVHKQLSGDRTVSLIVAPEKAFDDESISKSRPVGIAGTTGYYDVVRLFPLSADGKGGSAPMGTVIFHTPDGKWAFAYLKKNTDNNTQDGTPVDDPDEIVAAYNRLQVSFTSGKFRTPLKLKYLPADARLSAAGSTDGVTIDGRSDDLTTLDGNKQMSVTLMDSNPGFVDGTDCSNKALGCTTRLHRDFGGHTLLVDGIGYAMSETRKVFDNVQLAADPDDRSTYFTLADAIG